MSKKFEELPLKVNLIKNLSKLDYKLMTPIQEKSLPIVLDGKDIIAQAKTGSGKTAAFGLGLLNSLDVSNKAIQSFIMCPTRELADQVAKELRKLARMLPNVKILTLTGGSSEHHQERSLSHSAHIVVGTPGRVLRLLNKKTLSLHKVNTLVLDEADRMLDMGFYDDILKIISFIPEERQTLLFSATFPDEIKELSESLQHEAVQVKVDSEHTTSSIKQVFYELEGHQDKEEALLKVLGKYKPERLIVFCKTKQITKSVANLLKNHGICAEGIHGDLEQNDRTTILTMFSNRSLSVLVATDVAARGLDISDLEAVVNFDMPNNAEVYVHRVGRTGRAGQSGQAFSFYVPQEDNKVESIEDLTKCNIVKEDVYNLSSDHKYDLMPPMHTMYISGGKKDKLRPGDILGALTGEAKINSKDVGDISILNIVSYVAIKNDYIDQAIERLNNGKIKNRKFRVGLA